MYVYMDLICISVDKVYMYKYIYMFIYNENYNNNKIEREEEGLPLLFIDGVDLSRYVLLYMCMYIYKCI
jgi:hypothetical protein